MSSYEQLLAAFTQSVRDLKDLVLIRSPGTRALFFSTHRLPLIVHHLVFTLIISRFNWRILFSVRRAECATSSRGETYFRTPRPPTERVGRTPEASSVLGTSRDSKRTHQRYPGELASTPAAARLRRYPPGGTPRSTRLSAHSRHRPTHLSRFLKLFLMDQSRLHVLWSRTRRKKPRVHTFTRSHKMSSTIHPRQLFFFLPHICMHAYMRSQ
jgi:hypothetical protein